MRENTLIYIGLGIVFIIAAALNYSALRHFAYNKAEVNYYLSFGVPVLIDTFIAVAALIALTNKEKGESTRLAKTIVVVFTMASIYLNALHYPSTIYGVSMATLVPMVVFLSIELALQQMEINHRRNELILTRKKLNEQVQKIRADLDKIQADQIQLSNEQDSIIAAKRADIALINDEIRQRYEQLEAVRLELAQAKAALKTAGNCVIDWHCKEANLLRLDGMLAAGVTFTEAAQILNIAPNTARNWAKNLNGDSLSKGEVQQ
ncbi:MAG: hypothetical protein FOGNACKC_01970 [Anaerolineae bacterium]|nr:hypothetical protein [Anaerolineae bacterium]